MQPRCNLQPFLACLFCVALHYALLLCYCTMFLAVTFFVLRREERCGSHRDYLFPFEIKLYMGGFLEYPPLSSVLRTIFKRHKTPIRVFCLFVCFPKCSPRKCLYLYHNCSCLFLAMQHSSLELGVIYHPCIATN